ncbi:MAG: hypothetical protein NC925_03355 [Candidatus Omnitrophica bacterium]|nr:hypothetical protein [Candidatus Omnitrophota bacterium]
MDPQTISILVGLVSSFLYILKEIKTFFENIKEKTKLKEKIDLEIKIIWDGLTTLLSKIEKNSGARLKKETALNEMLKLMLKLPQLKLDILEYSKSYLPPAEKGNIKNLILRLDNFCEAIFSIEKPHRLGKIIEDISVKEVLETIENKDEELVDQFKTHFKNIDWKKYRVGYFKKLKIVLKRVYEAGRPYNF